MQEQTKEKQHSKKKSAKRFKIVIFSMLSFILVAIITLTAVACGMLKSMHGISYDTSLPIVEYTGEDVSHDYANPPGMEVTDEYGNTVTLDPDDTVDDAYATPSEGDDTSGTNETHDVYQSSGAGINKNYPIYKVDQKDPDVLNFIIVGRDVGSYYGRADSSMLISYNKKKNTVKIVSLMRDCYVPIAKDGRTDFWNKLGHSLSYGGMGLYINTVNEVFDLDIQQYAMIDFDGVVKVVNRLGGVSVNITKAEAKYYKDCYGYSYKVGKNTLNGEQVLRHCRNRSIGNDFERTRRQRDVIVAVYNKILSMGMSKGMDVIKMGLEYVKTNIPFDTCISMATDVFMHNGLDDLKTGSVPFADTYTSKTVIPPNQGYKKGMSVLVIDRDANVQKLKEYIYG